MQVFQGLGHSGQVSQNVGLNRGNDALTDNGNAGAAFGADGKPVNLPTYEELYKSLKAMDVLPSKFYNEPEQSATDHEAARGAFGINFKDSPDLSLLSPMDDSAGTKTGSPPFSPHNYSAPQYQGNVGQSDDEMYPDFPPLPPQDALLGMTDALSQVQDGVDQSDDEMYPDFPPLPPQDALMGMTDARSQVQDGVDQSDDEMSTITDFYTPSPQGDSEGMANDPYAPNIANLLDEEMGSADSHPFETQDDSEGMAPPDDDPASDVANTQFDGMNPVGFCPFFLELP